MVTPWVWGAGSSRARSDWREIHKAHSIERRQPNNRNATKTVTTDSPVVAKASHAKAAMATAHSTILLRGRMGVAPYADASFMRFKSAELTMTESELKAMAAAAIIGLRNPKAATGIATAL